MRLATTYLNGRIELLDAIYDQERFDAVRNLLALYNPVLGPITAVRLSRPGILDLPMYTSSASSMALTTLMPDIALQFASMNTAATSGGGKGPGMVQPFLSGLAEAAERLAGSLHFAAIVDQLVYASYRDLKRQKRRALGPEELPLFAPEQYAQPGFGFIPFEADTPLRWIEGQDLLSDEPVLVPAQLVLMYYKHHSAEGRIGYATSGGLSFHTDRRIGMLHGLYECIERDAINLRWYCKLAPPQVDIDLLDFLASSADLRLTRLTTPYIEKIQIFLNTLDIAIPIFSIVALDRSRQEHAFLGSGGAWSTRQRALVQALFELGQAQGVANAARQLQAKHQRANLHPNEMVNFVDAPIYYGNQKNLAKLSWYTAGERVISWQDVPSFLSHSIEEEYKAALNRLSADNLRPIMFDLNGSGWPGVSITKMLVPELTQACVPAYPYFGHPRFYELPYRLGFARQRLAFHQLHSEPLPFC